MKKLYTFLAIILLVKIASANPIITALKSGKWDKNQTWDLDRTPQDGDTVIIPIGYKVEIDEIINLSHSTIYLKIGGELRFDDGKLKVDENSSILLYYGATITGHDNSDKIKLGNKIKYKGSQGTLTGPLLADMTTGTTPNGFKPANYNPLPVHFSGFNVAVQNENVLVQWATASESNSAYFEIQRSENGVDWNTLGTLNAAGNSSELKTYSFTDYNVTVPVVYYRVKQVDIDGRFIMTDIRSAKIQLEKSDDTQIKISSGSNHNIYLHFSSAIPGNIAVRLISLSGQVVYNATISNPVGQQIINTNSNIKGIYIVAISNGQGIQKAGKVML